MEKQSFTAGARRLTQRIAENFKLSAILCAKLCVSAVKKN
jgi:hypothetical protein